MLRLPFFLVLFGLSGAVEFPTGTRDGGPAPYFRPDGPLVPDTYIVRLFRNHTLQRHFEHCGANLSELSHEFEEIPGLQGYRAELDNHTLHQLVRTDPGVEYVEHDHYVDEPTFAEDVEHEIHGNGGSMFSRMRLLRRWTAEIFQGSFWPAQMITAKAKVANLGSGTASVRTVASPGAQVNAYILDSGVRITHETFQGRASNFQGQTMTPYCGQGDQPMNDNPNRGHGTAVASVLAGAGFSVSTANLINVKIFCNAPTSLSRIAKAISDVTDEHRSNSKSPQNGFKGSIMNLSFTTAFSPTMEGAIEEANLAGVAIVAAGGNHNPPKPASSTFPCLLSTTICVTSCTKRYGFSSDFAAYGRKIDIISPGEDIPVAVASSDDATSIKSGTSIAAPIVGSVLSNFIAYEGLMTDTKTVRKRMNDNSVQNLITGLPTEDPKQITPNKLVNTGISLYSLGQGPYIGAPSNDDGELKARSMRIQGRIPSGGPAPNTSVPEASSTITTSFTFSWSSQVQATFEPILTISNASRPIILSASTS